MNSKVVVYRFTRLVHERDVSPTLMWGTPEAIARLDGYSLLKGSQRAVPAEMLEGGFFFEAVDIPDLEIEEAQRCSARPPARAESG
jgi:hypothetical protein